MQIGTDTKIPEGLNIPETLKVPEGNALKYVLHGVGVIDYKYNASDSTWNVAVGQLFYYNNPKDVSNVNLVVATLLGGPVDKYAKVLEGMIRSVIPGDNSSITSQTIAVDLNPKFNTVNGTVGKVMAREGTSFDDITYIQGIFDTEREPPEGPHPDGYVCRIPVNSTHLYYKSA